MDESVRLADLELEFRASGEASAEESTTGLATLALIDPDGNPILIDQHVDSPSNLKNTKAGKR